MRPGTPTADTRIARSTLVAGVGMLLLTAAFVVNAVDAIANGLADERTLIQVGVAVDTGGTAGAVIGWVLLALCLPYLAAALLLLRRRQSGRESAAFMTGLYGAVALLLSVTTLLGANPTPRAWIGVAIGLLNLGLLWLVLSRPTALDVEMAERRRHQTAR